MDFYLPEEHSAFRDVIRRWVDNECPKDWMRELENLGLSPFIARVACRSI